MTDVRMPDGTIVTNVPDGITQAQLMAKLGNPNAIKPGSPQALMASHPMPPGTQFSGLPQSVGPPPDQTDMEQLQAENKGIQNDMAYVHKQVTEGPRSRMSGPWNTDFNVQQAIRKPLLVGASTLATAPMGGWGGLVASSLAAGGSTTAGEMINQKREFGNVASSGDATKEGLYSAAGTGIAGGALKGLGWIAEGLFYSPLSNEAKAGLEFAKGRNAETLANAEDNNFAWALFGKPKDVKPKDLLTFPLSSAMPGSAAGNIQQASRLGLSGEIRTQVDANRVAQFLNREVAPITAKGSGSAIDEAALKGQQFLRSVFEPGEKVYTETFKNVRAALGDDTLIPLPNAAVALRSASDALKARKASGALVQQINALAKDTPSEQSVAQLDELYSELVKKGTKNSIARKEMSYVLDAIAKDIDEFGKPQGVDFIAPLKKAKAMRDELRGLRDIPQLQELSEDFGGKSRMWMAKMFGNPNGKALAELRARNPDLYHELADSWLGMNIQQFSKDSEKGIGRMLDGTKMRAWFEQNKDRINLIMGGDQAKALDNFSSYAASMSGASARANAGNTMNVTNLMPRAGALGTGLYYKPFLAAPTEAGSYVLAKGLSNPNSMLFKMFTEGFSDKTKTFMKMSGTLGGSAGGSAVKDAK